MNPEEFVSTASPMIGSIGAAFYFVPETLERGTTLGLDGFRFYFLGRGGVLGDVESEVITSAFGYFEPALVSKMWDSARQIADPRETARAYMEACHDFGRSHFSDLSGLEEFCSSAKKVVGATELAGLALFAGISAEALPDDLAARAMHLVAVLREFRGSVHLLAVVASGIKPKVAHYMRRPEFYSVFGYKEDDVPVISDDDKARLKEADLLTDRLVACPYQVLSSSELIQMLEVIQCMHATL